MRKSADTIFRLLAMLQVIPVHPKMSSTTEIHAQLAAKHADFDVDVRSIQRNLEDLSVHFPLSCDKKGRANYWYWTNKHAITQIPAMDKATAFTFQLAAENLKPVMPPSTLAVLEPYFKYAAGILQQTDLGDWMDKIRIINRGPKFIPPKIKPEVQEAVYEALLSDKKLKVSYRGKGRADPKCQMLNPLGIIQKNAIIYLLASAWTYREVRQYALHRITDARVEDERATGIPGFDLSRYVGEEDKFSYPLSDKKIKLRALFSSDAIVHLTESRLSKDQKITDRGDGRWLLEATVTDTAELRWWLLGFGGNVEILGPQSLRKEFLGIIEDMKNIYETGDKI